ncbi:hypothetical protein CPB83DRAFT_580456 [Crepidotus variabilis]|uniref:SET domain-containing protein n=1 Tax=Crepidotus variabilis TaxID=179855 RepID=A0A9P6EPH2_9AGAR|nr:hypothetical protein CPB83DRAFT_580456 [Crepidotus variabilis]
MKGFLLKAHAKKASAKARERSAVSRAQLDGQSRQTTETKTSAFPTGKINQTERDRSVLTDSSFDPREPRKEETVSDDKPPEKMSFFSMPQPADADGTSAWLVGNKTAMAQVIDSPGYPSRTPKPPRCDMTVFRQTIDQQKWGIFATGLIKSGELLFAERPLLVAPRSVPKHFRALPCPQYDDGRVMPLVLETYERMLKLSLDRLPADRQKTFMELPNARTELAGYPILGTFFTNNFGIENLKDNTTYDGYAGVCEMGSRFRHSCRPNIMQRFNLASFSFQFYAARDVEANEELFYAFCGVEGSAASRKARLAPYGIACKCSSCLNATPESDLLRTNFQSEIERLTEQTTECWKTGNKIRPEVLGNMLKLEQDMIKEGLDGISEFTAFLMVIGLTLKSMGQSSVAETYLTRCKGVVGIIDGSASA